MKNNLAPAKIRVVYLIMFVFAGLLLLFAFKWQLVDAEKFAKQAGDRSQNEIIPALRGTIYAADGSSLAFSEPRYNVFIYKPDLDFAEGANPPVQTRTEFVRKLAPLIDMTPEQLTAKLDENFNNKIQWFKIAEGITLEKGNEIKALTRDKDEALAEEKRGKLTGYRLASTARRVYPENQLASQLIGLTNIVSEDKAVTTEGQGGLEGEWNRFLEPREGFVSGEVDALGNAIGFAAEETTEAKRGSSLYTSIDKRVQRAVEERLEWGVKEFGAKSGSVIVTDPKSGEIIAMANYPTFNPNLRTTTEAEAYGNKAASEPYEIGSVGKTFTLSAALDLGVVDPGTVIMNGHTGCERISDELQPICTADKRPQGAMSIGDAFRKSDNLYFYHLAQRLRPQDFYKYLDSFGIGKASGIDVIGGGEQGSLKTYNKWNIADIAAYSYGHSYQITLAQAAAGVGALANYGTRMKLHVVTKVIEPDGTEIPYKPEALQQVVSKETVAKMDQIMHNVYLNSINAWEGQYLALKNYYIAMKSGTALIPYKDKLGYSSEFNATYVGYDASPDRRFLMIVRLEAPQVGNLSSSNARILWLETFKAIKDLLGVKRKGQF